MTDDRRGRVTFETSIDRAGLALGCGGMTCGVLATIFVAMNGSASGPALVTAAALGTMLGALAIGAVGGPVWLTMHAFGRRGPGSAAAAGAVLGGALFLLGQSGGAAAVADGALYGWLRALGSSLVMAAFAALISLLMWRIAYRRVERA
ncbi:MAG: hypothetical protein ACTHMG_07320 [Sphingomonas sp.]